MAAILGLLASLPELLKLFKTFAAWIEKVSGGDVAGFIAKTNKAFALLHKAESQAELEEAARAIQDAIRGTR